MKILIFFVLLGMIREMSLLVQIMAWRQNGSSFSGGQVCLDKTNAVRKTFNITKTLVHKQQ